MASRVFITYYTDPLCSWSWGMEPSWRRLRYAFGDQLRWRYKMGGLVADAETFDDPVNSVHRPAQWGPQWFEVRKKTGMRIDDKLWLDDPPDSSYPACVAIKAIQRQGPDLAEKGLRRLREAAMLERINIADREALDEVLSGLEGLDVERFRRDRQAGAREDFREDLREVRYRELGRFPALIVETAEQRASRGEDSQRMLIVGWRPYEVLEKAVQRVAPGLEPVRDASHPVGMVEAWGAATAPEVASMCGVEPESARELLDDAVEQGRLDFRETPAGEPLFETPAARDRRAQTNSRTA